MKDKQIEKLLKAETERQEKVINLIASENYVSKDVLTALGSELVNKYAEGYPGKRYYGGNQIVDQVEELCQARALRLFKLKPGQWSVNVQSLSGSPANLAVYLALVPQRGSDSDKILTGSSGKIMGLALDQGGHLTHGQKVSITGKIWKQIPYSVDPKTEQLDYEKIKKLALLEKPNIVVAGFTAYSRKIDFKKFREIANSCGALLMVDMAHIAGLVAAGVHPSPFLYADIVTTTTHKTLRGPRAGLIFTRRDERGLDKKIDKAVFPGLQGGPHLNQIAAIAVALAEAASPEFKKYAKQVVKNAKVLAKELQKRGWRIVANGTDNHLLLVDVVTSTGGRLAGKEASLLLEKAGIIVNKNAIPFDSRSPFDPSGLRLGTAPETSRGKTEKDMVKIAEKIDKILSQH